LRGIACGTLRGVAHACGVPFPLILRDGRVALAGCNRQTVRSQTARHRKSGRRAAPAPQNKLRGSQPIHYPPPFSASKSPHQSDGFVCGHADQTPDGTGARR